MPKPVSEQVVVITGASSGIGRASTVAFAAQGAKVICAARSKQALETLVEQVRQQGGVAVAAPTDVADPAAVRALADLAEQQFGRIDTWVNGAAISVWGRVDDITDAEFDGPVDGPGQVHGSHSGRILQHSLFTRLIGRRPRPGELVTAAMSRLRRPTDPGPVTPAAAVPTGDTTG